MPLYAPKPDVNQSDLLYLYKTGKVVSGQLLWKDEVQHEPTREELGDSVACLVQLVWRLQQVIAVREQDERIAEQIEKGFR